MAVEYTVEQLETHYRAYKACLIDLSEDHEAAQGYLLSIIKDAAELIDRIEAVYG